MYRLKLATTDEEIMEFEKMRTKFFGNDKTINSLKEATYAKDIASGDLLAFQCMEENEMVGGMLVKQSGKNIMISRLFVDPKKQGKGAGSFMIDYLSKHKEFFEDYYGTDINGILTEPLASTVDYFFDKGFDYSGFQMYKAYHKNRKKKR